MSPVYVRILDHPTDEQVEFMVELVRMAFQEDLSLPSMTGNKPNLEPLLFRSMIRAALLEGVVCVSGDSDNPGEIRSVAAWFPPGVRLFASEAQRELGWNEYLEGLDKSTRDWYFGEYREKHQQLSKMLLGDKGLNSWTAHLVATQPIHRRKGYATAIIKSLCARAQAGRSSVTLLTRKLENAKWYISLGFKLVSSVEVQATTGNWPDYFLVWDEVDETRKTITLSFAGEMHDGER